MPAKSKSQQRLMGMVHAYQAGTLDTKSIDPSLLTKIKEIAKSISKTDAMHFAQTKHKNKPETVENEEENCEVTLEDVDFIPMSFREFLLNEYAGRADDAEAAWKWIHDVMNTEERKSASGKKYTIDYRPDQHRFALINSDKPKVGIPLDDRSKFGSRIPTKEEDAMNLDLAVKKIRKSKDRIRQF